MHGTDIFETDSGRCQETRKEDFLAYYDYIRRLAESKCTSREDAEDLISETFLAAYTYLYHGGEIAYPKTWLANTLLHKFNSMLRRKYRQPVIVNYDTLDLPAPEESAFDHTEEAAEVRRELLYLSEIAREVLIRYYYNGYSVSDIAVQLGIPEGTVKSRLSAGRSKMKKGLIDMAEKKNNIPGRLRISFGGSADLDRLYSFVEDDLIVQNLLILAYEKPLAITELAEAISIPTVYIEPIVKKLTEGELMARNGEGKYYTDFIIYRPEDIIERFDAQKAFIHERFDRFWNILADLLAEIDALENCRNLNVRQLRKLERYGILRALQSFELKIPGEDEKTWPSRRDGGSWFAMGWAFPGGYDDTKYRQVTEYCVQGGHRTNGGNCDYAGAKYLRFCEFDTTLWDNPARWNETCGFSVYFREMKEFLWCIYKGISMEQGNISNTMLESVDRLIERTGLIVRENGRLAVDIPVMTREFYGRVEKCIRRACDRLAGELGEEYREYLKGNMLEIPRHLKGISNCRRCRPATACLVMSVVREAYEKGLHLADVDYCCPPAVLVYDTLT